MCPHAVKTRLCLHAPWAVALVLGLASLPAAALLGDDEARKSVAELRAGLEKNAQADQARADQAQAREQKLQAELKAVQEQLAEAMKRLDVLQREHAGQRAAVERLSREQRQAQAAAAQARAKAVAAAPDMPERVVAHGREFMATLVERRLYEDALARIRQRDFDAAIATLQRLQREHPGTGYAPLLPLWVSLAQGGLGRHAQAREGLQAFLEAHPGHALEPEALLALAQSQLGLRDRGAARASLRRLLAQHPASEAAALGRERLLELQ